MQLKLGQIVYRSVSDDCVREGQITWTFSGHVQIYWKELDRYEEWPRDDVINHMVIQCNK
jgi:hypothetical protein